MEKNNYTKSKVTLHSPSQPDGSIIFVEPSTKIPTHDDPLFLRVVTPEGDAHVHLDDDDTYELLDAIARATGAVIYWHNAVFGDEESLDVDDVEAAIAGL